MLLAWFGSVESLGVVATIEGKVNLPSASLVVNTFPACAATVSVVSAVKLTDDESVGITNYLGMRLSYQKKIEMCRKDKVAGLSKKPPAGFH